MYLSNLNYYFNEGSDLWGRMAGGRSERHALLPPIGAGVLLPAFSRSRKRLHLRPSGKVSSKKLGRAASRRIPSHEGVPKVDGFRARRNRERTRQCRSSPLSPALNRTAFAEKKIKRVIWCKCNWKIREIPPRRSDREDAPRADVIGKRERKRKR